MRRWSGILLLFIPGALTACDMCNGTMETTMDSPDGKYTAYVYTYGCGATSDTNTRVNIVKAGDTPVMGSLQYVALMEGEGGIYIDWTSTRSLEISTGGFSHDLDEDEWPEIAITFKK